MHATPALKTPRASTKGGLEVPTKVYTEAAAALWSMCRFKRQLPNPSIASSYKPWLTLPLCILAFNARREHGQSPAVRKLVNLTF